MANTTNNHVEQVLRKYLEALSQLDHHEKKHLVDLGTLVGPGAMIDDPAKWNSVLTAYHAATANLKAERDFSLEGLMAWHKDPSTNLILWKLNKP
ncbi:hypothetical protein [Agrobacterium vaccinii]|uniref:hypothetical protein n=1 Tax=Agrobacterium vaccinii TaxID=2735528 RepID=UPI001E59A7C4|nr:hypothetical protein [Agrobacterium vaccinii]UHS56033.1 hypothetical protein HRS00_03995 [Agrobacterium vaccinii]